MPNSVIFIDFGTFVMDKGVLVPNLAVVQNTEGVEHIFPKKNVPLETDITEE